MKFIKSLSLIHWLLLATICKQLLFWAIIPMWHGPDEQAHFAQVQYLAEFKRWFSSHDLNKFTTSREIFISEQLLGTSRDELGKNKFTHNPDYRIDYTSSTTGQHELAIRGTPKSWRTDLVIKEATVYPPLYYIISAIFYQLAYPLSLIDRIFMVRLASIAMSLGIVWLTYRIGKIIFPRNQLLSVTVATLVSFHPMASFLGVSVNSDNLMNLLFTWTLLLSVGIITQPKLSTHTLLSLGVIVILGMLTKPHFILAWPMLLTIPFFAWSKINAHYLKHHRLYWVVLIFSGLLLLRKIIAIVTNIHKGEGIGFAEINLSYLTHPAKPVSLPQHLVWTVRHTIAEVIPWYWGVFNWLGVALPKVVNRIINRALILAAIGASVWVIKHHHLRKWDSSPKALVFLGTSSVIFGLILTLWDWVFVLGNGFSFGMQGRYYFPLISAHMIWLLVGLVALLPTSWSKIQQLWIKFIGLSVILLNFTGLYTVTAAYYDLFPLTKFFAQVSQYKPIIVKYPWFMIWVILYILTLVPFIAKYISYEIPSQSGPKKSQ